MKNIRHYFFLRSELRGFLGVLLICTCTEVYAEQKLSADWVETLLLNDQTQRNYRGGVVYEDSLRQLIVKADSAHVRVGDATYLFVHQVSYKDTVREIRADTLVFQDREDLATFRGHVLLSDDQRTLEAHIVRFLSKEDSLIAEGDVVLLLPKGRRLRASQLRYDLIHERGNLQGPDAVTSDRGTRRYPRGAVRFHCLCQSRARTLSQWQPHIATGIHARKSLVWCVRGFCSCSFW